MPTNEREPESYGSERDWTTGKTGQRVSKATDERPPAHEAFYESRLEKEESGPSQGGVIQPAWTDEVDVLRPQRESERVDDPSRLVASTFGGARRNAYFKKRDYE